MTDDPKPARDSLDAIREQLRRTPEPTEPLHDFDPQAEARASMRQMRERTWATVMPNRLNAYRLAGADFYGKQVATELRAWADSPGGRNLVLVGPTGTGKSAAALSASHDLFVNGADVLFRPVVELLDALRPGGDPGVLEQVSYCDYLILDDLGAEKVTDWTWERLYAVVNRRWLEELPTVATSNLAVGALEDAVEPKLWSRLVGNEAVVLRLSGADKRRAAK